MKLDQLQEQFFTMLWSDIPEDLAQYIELPQQDKRLNIYRNNVIYALIEAVRSSFPTVERLVGEQFFSQLARQYIEQYKPDNARLLFFGKDFAAFLEDFAPLEEFEELIILPDIARIDYARIHAYHALDVVGISPDDVQKMGVENIAAKNFNLNPSASCIFSQYPIYQLWQQNQKQQVQEVSLDSSAESVLVMRDIEGVIVYDISSQISLFLQGCLQGMSIGEILVNIPEGADLVLAWVLRHNILVGDECDE